MKLNKKIVSILLSISTICSIGGILSTLSWFASIPQTVEPSIPSSLSTIDSYFDGSSGPGTGRGTNENPWRITRPVHYWNLTRLLNESTVYTQLTNSVIAFGDSSGQFYQSDSSNSKTTNKTLDMSSYSTKIRPLGLSDTRKVNFIIQGNNTTVANLTVSRGSKDTALDYYGVFGSVGSTAKIFNLNFDNLSINVQDSYPTGMQIGETVGLIAGHTENYSLSFSNVNVLSGSIFNDKDGSSYGSHYFASRNGFVGHDDDANYSQVGTSTDISLNVENDIHDNNDYGDYSNDQLVTKSSDESISYSNSKFSSAITGNGSLQDGFSLSNVGRIKSTKYPLYYKDGSNYQPVPTEANDVWSDNDGEDEIDTNSEDGKYITYDQDGDFIMRHVRQDAGGSGTYNLFTIRSGNKYLKYNSSNIDDETKEAPLSLTTVEPTNYETNPEYYFAFKNGSGTWLSSIPGTQFSAYIYCPSAAKYLVATDDEDDRIVFANVWDTVEGTMYTYNDLPINMFSFGSTSTRTIQYIEVNNGSVIYNASSETKFVIETTNNSVPASLLKKQSKAAHIAAETQAFKVDFKDTGTGTDGSTALGNTLTEYTDSSYFSEVSNTSKVYLAKEGYGLKFGSGSSIGRVTFSFSSLGQLKFSKISANIAKYNNSGDTGYFEITVNDGTNDISFGQQRNSETTLSSFDFEPDNTMTENAQSITIATTLKRAYIESLTFYTSGGEELYPDSCTISVDHQNLFTSDSILIDYEFTLSGEPVSLPSDFLGFTWEIKLPSGVSDYSHAIILDDDNELEIAGASNNDSFKVRLAFLDSNADYVYSNWITFSAFTNLNGMEKTISDDIPYDFKTYDDYDLYAKNGSNYLKLPKDVGQVSFSKLDNVWYCYLGENASNVTYRLATKRNDIKAGSEIIIATLNGECMIASKSQTNYLGINTITPSNNTISNPIASSIFLVKRSTTHINCFSLTNENQSKKIKGNDVSTTPGKFYLDLVSSSTEDDVLTETFDFVEKNNKVVVEFYRPTPKTSSYLGKHTINNTTIFELVGVDSSDNNLGFVYVKDKATSFLSDTYTQVSSIPSVFSNSERFDLIGYGSEGANSAPIINNNLITITGNSSTYLTHPAGTFNPLLYLKNCLLFCVDKSFFSSAYSVGTLSISLGSGSSTPYLVGHSGSKINCVDYNPIDSNARISIRQDQISTYAYAYLDNSGLVVDQFDSATRLILAFTANNNETIKVSSLNYKFNKLNGNTCSVNYESITQSGTTYEKNQKMFFAFSRSNSNRLKAITLTSSKNENSKITYTFNIVVSNSFDVRFFNFDTQNSVIKVNDQYNPYAVLSKNLEP